MRIFEGMPVDATDGRWGDVADIVVDPVARAVTHVVVKPSGEGARLVPVEAVVSADGRLALAWTIGELEAAEPVERTDFLELHDWPHLDEGWDVGVVRVLAWPYYVGDEPAAPAGRDEDVRTTTEFDRIPGGAAEVRRESPVLTSDGERIGHVDGLVLDSRHALTHLVLDKGHLWGHREVTIPVSAVAQVRTDEVRLTLTRQEVAALPSVPFHRHHG